MGYSDKHQGYKCYHSPSQQIFVLQHVVFDRITFPIPNDWVIPLQVILPYQFFKNVSPLYLH